MPLAEQQIAIPFAGGVDTKTDRKAVPPVKLRALENGVFTKTGTISKRTGYDGLAKSLDTGGEYASAKRLGVRDGELVLFANDRAYSYREASDTWSLIGRAESIVHTETPIARTGTMQTTGDAATKNGVTAVAWEDSRGGVWWACVEQATGRVLRPASQLDANGQRPRVVAVGAALHVYYAVAADARIWCVVVNPDDYLSSSIAAVVLTDDLAPANPSYDIAPTPRAGTPAAITWARNGGGYRTGYVDTSGVLGSPATGHPTVATWADAVSGPVAVAYSPDVDGGSGSTATVWIDGLDVKWRMHEAEALLGEYATGTIHTLGTAAVRVAAVWSVGLGSGAGGGVDLWMMAEEPSGGLARDHRVWVGFAEQGGAIGGDTLTAPLRGHGLAARMFTDGQGIYAIVTHAVPFFPYAALLRIATEGDTTTPTITTVGRLLVGVASGLPPRGHLPSVEVDAADARVHRWIGAYREQVDAAPVSTITATPAVPQYLETGLRVVSLDFDHVDAFRSAQLGADLVIGGACPLRYDGDTIAELGLHTAPDDTITVARAGGGSLTASSTYLYCYSYDEIDAQGEIHAGPLSIGTLVVMGVGETRTTHTIPTYRLTGKRRVRINVWRSLSNEGDPAAPTVFRVSSLDASVAAGSNRYVSNDTTVDSVTFVDDMSDAAIRTKERAYVTGGVLSNDPAPLGAVVVGGKNRLFFTDPTNPHAIRFTQERRAGYAPEPCADLFTVADPAGGPIVALGVLDDKVIVFKSAAIYFFAGPGPLANPDDPNSPGFSPPALVTSDVGCSSAASVAVVPDGLVFQSGKGIYRIGRGLQVEYIGAPVEAYNAQRVTHAALLSDRTEVLFLAESGLSLLFNYYRNEWSTFTNHAGLDGALVEGTYHYLRTDGRVFVEDRTSYRDDNMPIRLALETAWLHMVGYLQGWMWFYYVSLLGTFKAPHTLRVRMRLDYETGWGEPFNLDVGSNYNPAEYGEGNYGAGVYGGDADTHDTRYQRQIHVGALGQSISLRIEDVASSGDLGDSFELTELLLTGGTIAVKALLGPTRRS